MALTVYRTARSFVVKEALDFSTALFMADGQLIAQGTCLPFHLGAMPFAVRAVTRAYGDRILPGDLYITNDPYDGSTHLPDIVLVKPIFHERDAHRLFRRACAHDGHRRAHPGRQRQRFDRDLPGRTAHSAVASLARRRARRNHVPADRAQRARARTRFWATSARWSRRASSASASSSSSTSATVASRSSSIVATCSTTPSASRAPRSPSCPRARGISSIISTAMALDPGAIRIEATVTIRADDMTIDLTGSAPQVRGAINCVYPFTLSTALACVRSIVDLSIPNNAGYFRPIEVIAPEGTVVNPRPPAAVAARGITGIRIADTIFGALAQAVPDILPACGSNAPDVGISFGGIDARGRSARLSRISSRVVGRRTGSRRDGRVHGHVGELLQRARRNDRGRPAHRGRALRAGAG